MRDRVRVDGGMGKGEDRVNDAVLALHRVFEVEI